MYYPDLSPCPDGILPFGDDLSMLCVGWLDENHSYTQGDVSTAFIERLWTFCCHPVFQTWGYHECPFCTEPSFGVKEQHGQEKYSLGSAEIRVLGKGLVYAAPNMIYHYVAHHHYSPPEEFIQAVLEGPLPGSPEYEAVQEERDWE